MDNSNPRKSDAAATRKRRSSILKSQRAPRAPLSELEFNVATPQDQAKSRRVSFSRRTGVAEFEIHEATTAWKNVYEEHNKSLETSGAEAGGARPRRVQQLGARRAQLFQDTEAELVPDGEASPPRADLELSQLTAQRTGDVFRAADAARRDATDRLDLDFSAVAPLPDVDDFDALQRDLDADRRADMSECDIDVDFNATHFTLKADESDDMSITDSVHSPRVAAADRRLDDWTADKENVVVNPYAAPPPADFECDDVLVFDGKKCKFQSNLDLSDDAAEPSGNASQRRTITCDAAEEDALPSRTALADGPLAGVGAVPERASNTVFFDDVADMTMTQAVPAQLLQKEAEIVCADDGRVSAAAAPRRRAIVYREDADMSVTQSVPVRIIAPIQIACDGDPTVPSDGPGSKAEHQKTMYCDDLADISVTQTLPTNIIQREPERRETNVAVSVAGAPLATGVDGCAAGLEGAASQPHTDRRSIVYGRDDGSLSATGELPPNILDKDEAKPNHATTSARRTTIVYGKDDCDVSLTGVVPASIIVDRKEEKLGEASNTHRRKTIVYGNDDCNMSMTGVVPVNIVVDRNEQKMAQPANADHRKTVIYGNDDGNVSMTGVVPPNIIVNAGEAKLTRIANIDQSKTIAYGNYDETMSMTGVIPVNLMVDSYAKLAPSESIHMRTIVYGNDDGNISMTGVVPANIMVKDSAELAQPTASERRKTVLFGNDAGNVSMTGVVPTNIIVNKSETTLTQPTNTDRRKTIVYGNDGGNISVTGVVPANIIVDKSETKLSQASSTDRRKTIVYGNDDGNISMTGVVPVNIKIYSDVANPAPSENTRRKTIIYGNDDGNISMTGVVPANIMVKDSAELAQPAASESRKTVLFGTDDGNVSMTGIVPTNIIVNKSATTLTQRMNTDRRKTIVYGNDDGNISVTRVVPASIIVDKSETKLTQASSTEPRKTIVYGNDDSNISMTGVVPVNILVDRNESNQTLHTNTERRKTIVHGNDESDISTIGVVPAHVMVAGEHEDRTTLIHPANTERRETLVDSEDGDISMRGDILTDVVVYTDSYQSQPTNPERNKTVVYGNDDGHISMAEVVPGHVVVAEEPEDKAKLNLSTNDHRRKTVVSGNKDGNDSMTVVPANVTLDKDGAMTQPIEIEHRDTIVYGNEGGDISVTGVAPADVIENEDRQTHSDRRKTVVYGNDDDNISITGIVSAQIMIEKGDEDVEEITGKNGSHRETVDNEEGDVSMTEAEPGVAPETTGSGSAHTTQQTELKDIICYSKNDQVSIAQVPRPTSIETNGDASMKTSAAVTDRQSLGDNVAYDDLSHSEAKNVSAFHKSSVSEVLVYETSVRGSAELSKSVQHADARDDRGSRSTYACSRDVDVQTRTSSPDRAAVDEVSLATTADFASKLDVQSRSAAPDRTSTLDAFSRSLAADRTSAVDARSESSVSDSTAILDPASRSAAPNRTSVFGDLFCKLALERMSPDPPHRSSAPGRTSVLDGISHALGADRSVAFDVLSRSLAPDRVSILEALSPKSVLERAALSCKSPPASVLDSLLDMSSMDDEPFDAFATKPRDKPTRADGDATVTVAPAISDSCIIIRDDEDPTKNETIHVGDSDDEAADERETPALGRMRTPALEYKEENHGIVEESHRRSGEPRGLIEEKSIERDHSSAEGENMEQDEGNQTEWATSCAATQVDDTRALLDALSDFTDTRHSGDFEPRRSLAPDRRSMVRSREDLLKDISMAQAMMQTEMEQSSDSTELEEAEEEAQEEASSPRLGADVVKTLRFDDDSVRDSPRLLHKPAPVERESRRAPVIPPYLRDVGEIKDLMEELVKPMADVSPFRERAVRSSQVQADLFPSSQIDLTPARAAGRARTPSPLARAPGPAGAVVLFDRLNPLNNVVLPPMAGAPHRYEPSRGEPEPCVSPSPSLEPRATQTDRASPPASPATEQPACRAASPSRRLSSPRVVFALLPPTPAREPAAGEARDAREPAAGEARDACEPAAGELRKRGHTPADLRSLDVTPKPAVKVQKMSSPTKVARQPRSASPAARGGRSVSPPARGGRSVSPAARGGHSVSPPVRGGTRAASPRSPGSGSTLTVQQLLSEFRLSEAGTAASTATLETVAEPRGARPAALHGSRSADSVCERGSANVVARIDVLPFMGTECSWEARAGDAWSFRLLRGRLRLCVRLAHRVHHARSVVHGAAPVALVVVQHNQPHHDVSDPVAAWCVRLAAGALQHAARDVRRAGHVPALLRRGVLAARRALRWARALNHARAALALQLDDDGRLALKVANIPLRCVWEVTLRVQLAVEETAAWPRAGDVHVARVLAGWAPTDEELQRLLEPLPEDWGHVPRTIWRIFKYLKHKRPEDELVLGA